MITMAKGFSLSELMNAQSRPDNKPQRFESKDIPIGLLQPSAKNEYGIRDIEELAASIESMGLMHDLLVKPADAQGRYEIISGERRYRACLLLHEADAAKFATVPCKVAESESEALSELRLIYANATARELTDHEKTYQAGRIKELLQQLKTEGYRFQGRMRDIVADILSVSSAQMGRMESINEHLNEGFKAEFASGNIGISTAYDASTLPEAKQAEALDALRTGKTDAVRSAVRAARDRKLAGTVKHYDAPEPEDLQPIVPEPAPSMPVVPSPEHRRSILDGVLNDQRTAEAKRLARQLRKAATGIPFDAVCDDAGDEVNIRAACLSAARLLEAFAGQ
jgi:ParB family chromosome partitioning protein